MNEEVTSPHRKIKWHIVMPVLFWVVVAAICVPLIWRSRKNSREQAERNFCINQIMQIDAAKEQARMRFNWPAGTQVVNGDTNVNTYIKGLARTTNTPICPSGGKYSYNPIGVNPTCTFPGHALSGP